MPYSVKLNTFEGPLDLLLHLIKKNELDIYDIPIATITEQYLEYMGIMHTLNLDVAGEFLVMAATLMQIKSKMLLPQEEEPEETEEGEDPRAELVKRLIEYQKFKNAAKQLIERDILERDVFVSGGSPWDMEDNAEDVRELNIFELVEAFERVLKDGAPQELFHITAERISINDKIMEIIERMKGVTSITFQSLFRGATDRPNIILTFLALLELTRLKMLKVVQIAPFETIRICPIHLDLPENFDLCG